jgi:hypothetical protein
MMTTNPSGEKTPVDKSPLDDLVEDRAIGDSGGDILRRGDFVAQAAAVIRVIETPANIAIYAPWGSGKTSLSNLLKNELQDDSVRFVRFDAFKYAEAPLRREFVRSVAKDLGIKDQEFSDGLYEEVTSTDLDLQGTKVRKLLGTVATIFVVSLILLFVVALIISNSSTKGIKSEWLHEVGALVPFFASPAIFVGLVATLAAGVLNVTRTRSAPNSDEDFERLFRKLVNKVFDLHANCKRIVIFIDELDRCSAEEVASTLETLKTFLEIDQCVFIVAADRAVLEEAISQKVRQETPYNAQNPYYSVGSSYLDKIFQYQWQLPPIRSGSLTRFAIELVSKRTSGLWTQIDLDEVVSVLVPAHVQSPRRIKELLNAYAMAYRLAERRIASHFLSINLRNRASELAKLVCLQMEFPVFANELPDEPRLPQLVLELFLHPEQSSRPPGVTEEIWQRALSYANREVVLDALIAESPKGADEAEVGVGGDAVDDRSEGQQVSRVQGQLLMRYLQRTELIDGPKADLIFFEDLGHAFGLPGTLAERLQQAGIGNRPDEVARILQTLEPAFQLAALRLLAQGVREAQPGIDGSNAFQVFLASIGSVPDLDLTTAVDELIAAATAGFRKNKLSGAEIIGAICLGLNKSDGIGLELLSNAMEEPTAISDSTTAKIVAQRASEFPETQITRVADAVANLVCIHSWPEGPEVVVTSWTDSVGARIFDLAAAPILKIIDEGPMPPLLLPAEIPSDAPVEVVPPTDPAADKSARADFFVGQIRPIAKRLADTDRQLLLESSMSMILKINHRDARDLVEILLPKAKPIADAALTSAVLTSCIPRTSNAKATWIDALDPAIVQSLDHRVDLVANVIVAMLSDDAMKTYDPIAFRNLSRLLSTLIGGALNITTDAMTKRVEYLSGHLVLDEPGILNWKNAALLCHVLEEEGWLEAERWRPLFLTAGQVLASTTPTSPEIRVVTLATIEDDLKNFTEGSTNESIDQLSDGLLNSPWLVPAEKAFARMRLIESVPGVDISSVLSAADLNALLDAIPASGTEELAFRAAGEWFSRPHLANDEVWEVAKRFAFGIVPDQIKSGLRKFVSEIDPAQKTSLACLALSEYPNQSASDEFLDTIDFAHSELQSSTAMLADMSVHASNDDQRKTIFRLWGALKLTEHRLVEALYKAVCEPWISFSKSSRELVVTNLNLLQGLSRRQKTSIAKGIESAADPDEWESISKRLEAAGFMKSTGLINKRTVHLDD